MNQNTTHTNNHPFNAPEGFHEDFHRKLMLRIEHDEWTSEVPVLSSLPRPKDLTAPEGFFEHFSERLMSELPKSKVVRMSTAQKTIINIVSVAAVVLLVFSVLRPETNDSDREVALTNVDREALEFYISEELPYEVDNSEITEFLALETGSTLTGTSFDLLTEYIEEEIPYYELVSEF